MSTETTMIAETIMEIPQPLKDALMTELCNTAKTFIDNVDESGDCYGDTYGWEDCEDEYEDGLYLDEPYDEWECSFKFIANWKYCVWTEVWYDPYCTPSFSETKDFNCELDELEIIDPDGNKVDKSVIAEIVKEVNKQIMH